MGAGGMSAAAVLSSNMVYSAAHASIDGSTRGRRTATSTVSASDEADDRRARRRCSRSVSPTNDAGRRDPEPARRRAPRRLRVHEPLRARARALRRRGAHRRRHRLPVHGRGRRRSTSTRPRRTTRDYGYWKPLSRAQPDHRRARLRRAVGARHGARQRRADRQRGELLRPDRPQRPAQRGAGVDHRHAGHRGRRRGGVGDRGGDAGRVRRQPRADVGRARRGDRHQRRALERAGVDRGRRRSTPAASTVSAENVSTLDATATSKIEGFDETFGAVVAFNSIGWKSSQHPLQRARRAARRPADLGRVRRRQHAVGRAGLDPRHAGRRRPATCRVTASQAAQLTATTGNEGVADAQLDARALARARRRPASRAAACWRRTRSTRSRGRSSSSPARQGTVDAGGDVTVSATDAAEPRGARHRRAERDRRRTRRPGSPSTLSDLLPNDNDYTTKSGDARDQAGRRTCGSAADDGALGVVGHVYEFNGLVPDDARPRRRGLHRHRALDRPHASQPTLADFYPNIGNLTKSNARAIGILVVMNDLRAASEAYLDNAIVDAGGSVTVNAEEIGAAPVRGDEHGRPPRAARSTAPARCRRSTARS